MKIRDTRPASYERILGRDRTILGDGGRRSAPGEIDGVSGCDSAGDIGEDNGLGDMGALVAQVFQARIVELKGGVVEHKMHKQVPDERESGAARDVKSGRRGRGSLANVREQAPAVAAEGAGGARRVDVADRAHVSEYARGRQRALVEAIYRNDEAGRRDDHASATAFPWESLRRRAARLGGRRTAPGGR